MILDYERNVLGYSIDRREREKKESRLEKRSYIID
jgi:hypothetical protein